MCLHTWVCEQCGQRKRVHTVCRGQCRQFKRTNVCFMCIQKMDYQLRYPDASARAARMPTTFNIDVFKDITYTNLDVSLFSYFHRFVE